ncbi:MAG: N-methyl-L-tryptophan oxidase [Chloroflexaceae bacterium]|nr:N-methyl-L-tryptophan oxidase [Chloroflexaceae bacterium]
MGTVYDTIVLGLGGMGSATAAALAQRGRRVLGLEQYTPAHTLGSSHGESRIIRQAYFEGTDYVPLLLEAYELWAQIEHDQHQRGALLQITGGLLIGAQDSQIITGSLHSARTHGIAHHLLAPDDLRRRYPMFQPQQPLYALYEPHGGVLNPEQCIRTYLQHAQQHGADLHFSEAVQEWQVAADGSSVRVTTERGSYTAETLVIGAGAWSGAVLAELQLPLVVERQVMFWVQPQGDVQQFRVPHFPFFIAELEPGLEPYGFPIIGDPAGGVKVSLFYNGTPCTPATLNRTATASEFDALRPTFAALLPELDGTVLRAVTCMYTCTPDHHFVVGLHPHHPNVSIAAGFSGHGFKFCSVIGAILADLAHTGSTSRPLGLFDPMRFRAG